MSVSATMVTTKISRVIPPIRDPDINKIMTIANWRKPWSVRPEKVRPKLFFKVDSICMSKV